MKHAQQLLLIHGGMTFKNRKDYVKYLRTRPVSLEDRQHWSRANLDKALGPKFRAIRPRMPLQDNARYEEWEIAFERYIPLLKHGVILIGTSLGGTFLAKYLSEHRFPKKLRALYLVCPPFDNTHSIASDKLYGGFVLKKNLSLLEKNVKKLTLMFSHDDPSVPPYHAKRFAKALPHAKVIMYRNKRGHFRVSTFPEIVKMLKVDMRQSRT
jgi:predicted alpha/beta hydrolase family esterase